MSPDITKALRTGAGQIAMLGAGLLGGWLFSLMHVPAPWLAGPMTITVLLVGLRIAPPMLPQVRDVAMLMAGVSLGVSVTPDALHALGAYPVSLTLLCVGMVMLMAGSSLALTVLRGWSVRDAFFASAPGALSTVLVIAVEERADVPRIAVVQIVRLFVLILVLPGIVGSLAPAFDANLPPPPTVDAPALALLLAAALVGWAAMNRMRVSADIMLGSMLGSALLTGTGTLSGQVPPAISTLGFVLVGCFIGQRFRGVEWTLLVRLLPDALIAVVVGLGVAVGISALVEKLADVPFESAIVALAPGGLEAMTMLALALKIDPVYVSVHHTVRFLFVGAWVPLAVRMFPRLLGGRGRADEPREPPADP
ncbi:AbrB family transcriptional regulator [Alsobacter sp. SYSU M60028]|uniref:AbrB family transcriptional regulator n=1 Tax=Alsobacter ponti TaxID=2962936 RepID=A0ABT1LET9_9HYPH|nr:AbrB family transcriptional regulator [Alsobacter ponti]MCP8940015.1 AbrB family transcriptional regulator [Alsobacter ponti]